MGGFHSKCQYSQNLNQRQESCKNEQKARQNSNNAALPRFISNVSTCSAKDRKIGRLSPSRPIISTENDTLSHHTTSIADAFRNQTKFSKTAIVYIGGSIKYRNFSTAEKSYYEENCYNVEKIFETGCFFLDIGAFL